MGRRSLIITDSDEEDAAATPASASASVSTGGGIVRRPSSQNPSLFPAPYTFPSSPPPSPPVEISDDEEEVDEIQDPDEDPAFGDAPDEMQDSDGDSMFTDVADDLSPPPPAPPQHPPPQTPCPPPAPAPAVPLFRTPTPTPPPASTPPSGTRTPVPPPAAAPTPPARTRTPIPSPAAAHTTARTPTPTPPPIAAPNPMSRTPTPTPPPAAASAPPARTPTPTPSPAAASAPRPRTPTPTPPPAWTPTTTPLTSSTPPSALSAQLRPVDAFLRRLGLRVRPEWLQQCAAGLSGFNGHGGTEVQARQCFEQFLFADMNECGAGVLPEGVGCMEAATLDGPFVLQYTALVPLLVQHSYAMYSMVLLWWILQVDEIVNMSAPLRERYRDAHAGPKRCLKLSMTDGIQRIYGMEYRPIKDLEVLAPAGFKIVIRNVHIKRGLLMLVPEVIEILGGVVDELEAARVRLVSEVNKPPRGKRKQGGLPLSSRATLAAWPRNISAANGGEQGISMPRTVNSSHPTGLGNGSQVGRTTQTMQEERINHPVVVNGVRAQRQHFQENTMQDRSTSLTGNNAEASAPATYRHEPQQSTSRISRTLVDGYVDHPIVANNVDEQIQRVQEITMQDQATAFTRNRGEPSASTPYAGYDSQQRAHDIGATGANGVETAQPSTVDDKTGQMEHPVILSGENEKPFIYIFNLMAHWAIEKDTRPYIQGKIKGLITSVKRFQFRNRKEYELIVCIDDGSQISEAFVDCVIVRNIIGHPCEEVSTAVSDPTSESYIVMKQILNRFQHYLEKFERGRGFNHDDGGSSMTSSSGGMRRGRCYNCGVRGHFSRDCTKPRKAEVAEQALLVDGNVQDDGLL
ncbi:recQ-mediated genome instability protein 1 [Hordeum vulgare]|nr:recQ-mediated genome instability protein 1 [Hordeum vulgare]